MTSDEQKKLQRKKLVRNILKVLVVILLILIAFMVFCRLSSDSSASPVAVPQYRFEFFG